MYMATVLISARPMESIFLKIILIVFIVKTGVMIGVYLLSWKYWIYAISDDPDESLRSVTFDETN